MINPEAIRKRLAEVETEIKATVSYSTVRYLEGARDGFNICLTMAEDISVDSIQAEINHIKNQDGFPFWDGKREALIEVGRMVQMDQARDRRDSEVRCASRYAEIQQGRIRS